MMEWRPQQVGLPRNTAIDDMGTLSVLAALDLELRHTLPYCTLHELPHMAFGSETATVPTR